MIIQTNSQRIKCQGEPKWNEFHKCFYVYGHRWIKSRQSWSGSCLLHNFTSYTVE